MPGTYAAIVPGIVLLHARPEDGVPHQVSLVLIALVKLVALGFTVLYAIVPGIIMWALVNLLGISGSGIFIDVRTVVLLGVGVFGGHLAYCRRPTAPAVTL